MRPRFQEADSRSPWLATAPAAEIEALKQGSSLEVAEAVSADEPQAEAVAEAATPEELASLIDFKLENRRVLDMLTAKMRTVEDCQRIAEAVRSIVGHLKFLDDANAQQASAFFRRLEVREAAEGHTIVREGERIAAVYVVFHGRVVGKDAALEAGELFGDVFFGGNESQWPATFTAATDSLLLASPLEDSPVKPFLGLPADVDEGLAMMGMPEANVRAIARFLRAYAFFQQCPIDTVREVAAAATVSRHSAGDDVELPVFRERRSTRGLSCVMREDARKLSLVGSTTTDEQPARAEWMFFVLTGTVNDESFRAGDALVLSDLCGMSDSLHLVCDGEVALLRLPPDGFRASIGSLVLTRSLVFPMATCLDLLRKETRSAVETSFLAKHASRVGRGGIEGCFGHMSPNLRTSLCRHLKLQYVAAGQPICYQGDKGSAFYVVLTGSASVYERNESQRASRASWTSRPQRRAPRKSFRASLSDLENDDDEGGRLGTTNDVLGLKTNALTPGDSFGERSLLFATPRSSSIAARKACLLLVLDAAAFEEAIIGESGLVIAADLALDLVAKADRSRPSVECLLVTYLMTTFAFLNQLGRDVVSRLLPGLGMLRCNQGTYIYKQGQECDQLFVIVAGAVQLVHTTVSKEATTRATLGVGDVFGTEGLLLQTAGRPQSAVAAAPKTAVLRVSRDAILEWHKLAPASVEQILKVEESWKVLRYVAPAARNDDDVAGVVDTCLERQIFEQFPRDFLKYVCRHGHLRHVHKDDVIWYPADDDEDDDPTPVYFVVHGAVAVYVDDDADDDPALRFCTPKSQEDDDTGWRLGYGRHVVSLVSGDAFGEPQEHRGVLRGATLVAAEPTDLLVVGQVQWDFCCFRARPSILERRLQEGEHGAEFYEALLRGIFRDATTDLAALTPHIRCRRYAPGEDLVQQGDEARAVWLVILGSVDVVVKDSKVGELEAGDQFGHMPLLWKEATTPVGYRAKSRVIVANIDRRSYQTRWRNVYDSAELGLATFLQSMPLLEALPLADVLCIRHKLKLQNMVRGTLLREDEMNDSVLFILSGECHLVARDRKRPLATLARYAAFGDFRDGKRPPVGLVCTTATTFIRLPRSYLRELDLLDSLAASMDLMLDWTYANVRPRALTPNVLDARIKDGQQIIKSALPSIVKAASPTPPMPRLLARKPSPRKQLASSAILKQKPTRGPTKPTTTTTASLRRRPPRHLAPSLATSLATSKAARTVVSQTQQHTTALPKLSFLRPTPLDHSFDNGGSLLPATIFG